MFNIVGKEKEIIALIELFEEEMSPTFCKENCNVLLYKSETEKLFHDFLKESSQCSEILKIFSYVNGKQENMYHIFEIGGTRIDLREDYSDWISAHLIVNLEKYFVIGDFQVGDYEKVKTFLKSVRKIPIFRYNGIPYPIDYLEIYQTLGVINVPSDRLAIFQTYEANFEWFNTKFGTYFKPLDYKLK